MTTKKLSKLAEDRLLSSVKDLCQSVEDGMSPTEAAVKAANANSYGTEMIKLMCQGYNVGAVNNQRDAGGSVLRKLASVPLIDVEAVTSLCFPQTLPTPAQEKSASVVDACYGKPPKAPTSVKVEWQEKRAADLRFKKAEETPPPPKPLFTQLRELDEGIKSARLAVTSTQIAALSNLGKLADYFKQSSAMPIEEFEAVAKAKYGPSAEKLSDYIRVRNNQPAVKRAAVQAPVTAVLWSQAPYSLLEPALTSLLAYKQACHDRQVVAFENHVKAAKLLHPNERAPRSVLPPLQKTAETKHADAITNMLTWNAGRAGYENLFEDPDPGKEKGQVSDELVELSDPEHEDELREVRTQRMLHDLMKNDQVLAGYPHKQVIDAYNDLADFSPRIADKPIMVRSVLRKWLPQGQLDTFEASDLASTEKTLSDIGKSPANSQFKVSNAKSSARSRVLVAR